MALAGWNANQKLKLTIDGSKIEGDLTDFPVNITLSSGTGITGFDATDVFDKLTPTLISGTSFLYNGIGAGDVSGNNHSLDVYGNPYLVTGVTVSGLSGYVLLDGTGDHFNISASTGWEFSTGAFTIDYWIYPTDDAEHMLFMTGYDLTTRGLFMRRHANGGLSVYASTTGANWDQTLDTSGTVLSGEWSHIAIVKGNGTVPIKLYVNGVYINQTGSISTIAYSANHKIHLGAYYVNNTFNTGITPWAGRIAEFRVSKGIERWASAFPVPTAPQITDEYTSLLLHFEGDKSLHAHDMQLVGGTFANSFAPVPNVPSYYFGGSSYVTVADASSINLGTSDFTLECWARISAGGAHQVFVAKGKNSGTDYFDLIVLKINSSNYIQFVLVTDVHVTSAVVNSLSTATVGVWYHLAGTLDNSTKTMELFVNGISQGTAVYGTTIDLEETNPLTIGAFMDNESGWSQYLTGFVADVRLTKGSILYTDDFTKPAGPAGSSWWNREKLIVTDSNDNKLYTEIAYWDSINQEASLWTRVPTLSSGTDKELVLYYDAAVSGTDQKRYIGEASDSVSVDYISPADYFYPYVIKDGDTYKMWYSYSDEIYYMTSTDKETWSSATKVVSKGSQGVYDTSKAIACSVIKDGTTYRMLYSAYNGVNYRICYCDSSNGTTWSNFQLVIDKNVVGTYDADRALIPRLIKVGSTYKVLYAGNSAATTSVLIYADSTDCINWNNHTVVISESPTYNSHYHSFVYDSFDGLYKTWYANNVDGWDRIQYRESATASGIWTDKTIAWENNFEGTYDTGAMLGSCTLIEDDGAYSQWYMGHNGSNYRTIYFKSYTYNTCIPSHNVWDSNFVGVWHMDTTPTGSILDSTSYGNNGTSAGTMTDGDLVDGIVGKAIDFDGNDDVVTAADAASLDILGPLSLEVTFKPNENIPTDQNNLLLGKIGSGSGDSAYGLSWFNWGSGRLHFWLSDGAGYFFNTTQTSWTTGNWYNVTATWDGTTNANSVAFYVNDTTKLGTSTKSTLQNVATPFYIGGNASYGYPAIIFDEIRVSKVARSANWVKASYYSNWNSLISFDTFDFANFFFTSAAPASGTSYGTTSPLYITVTVSGSASSYTFDASFYDGGDVQIGTTISGEDSGNQITRTLSTPSGTSYSWYVTATASGFSDTSETYTFDNRFLCAGYTMVNGTRTSGIPVRLYRREDGSLQGETTSAGVSGTFDIETLYNEEHYAVALHPDGAINALIYDHIIP